MSELIINLVLFSIAGLVLMMALIIGSSAIAIFLTRVPFAPTPEKRVKIVFDNLNLKAGQIFYDLGCGDGRFLLEAERRGIKATGFEVSPWVYLRAKLNLWKNHCQAKIIYKNFYSVNLADADGIFCFLMDEVMPKVERKLEKELTTGTKVAAYGFALPNWQPEKIIDLNPPNKKSSKIYFYIKN